MNEQIVSVGWGCFSLLWICMLSTVLDRFAVFSQSPESRSGISPTLFFIRLLPNMILTILRDKGP